MVQAIFAGIAPLADRYISLKEKEFKHMVELERAMAKAAWWVLLILMVFLAIVIALMVALVMLDRVSGDALLFLVGTVAGFVFAIVQRHLFPQIVEASEE